MEKINTDFKSDKLVKFRLNFSICTNHDEAPLMRPQCTCGVTCEFFVLVIVSVVEVEVIHRIIFLRSLAS